MGDAVVGYVALGVAAVCFGSCFVPVKRFETGDGLFFQWIFCLAIWVCGFAVEVQQGFPEFVPLAMLGGVIWCTGNLTVVPILKTIGLGVGVSTWSSVAMLWGWAVGTFGLFGLRATVVPYPWLNYLGAGLAVGTIVCFMLVKPPDTAKRTLSGIPSDDSETAVFLDNTVQGTSERKPTWGEDGFDPMDKLTSLPDLSKKILGFGMSIFGGLCYGSNFIPPQYVMQKVKGASQEGLHYVFSHFTGILLMSTFAMLLYSILMKNNPRVYPRIVAPVFGSGILWAAAQISWFLALAVVPQVVTFPILSVMPAIISTLWGYFLFGENRGRRNVIILLIAGALCVASVTCVALSNRKPEVSPMPSPSPNATVPTPFSPSSMAEPSPLANSPSRVAKSPSKRAPVPTPVSPSKAVH